MMHFAHRHPGLSIICLLYITSGLYGQVATPQTFDPFAGNQDVLSPDAMPSGAPGSDSNPGPMMPPLDFAGDDISDVLSIISKAAGWSIFQSKEVSGAKVTFSTDRITALELLDQVVKLAGFVYHRKGNLITVVTYDEYSQHYGVAREIIPLEFGDPVSVAAVIEKFRTKVAKIVVHTDTNTIILYEVPANLKTLTDLVKRLDTPVEDTVTQVVNLKYADCLEFADVLGKVYAAPKRGRTPPKLQAASGRITKPESAPATTHVGIPHPTVGVYAVTHANQIVIVGTQGDIDKVHELVKQMDVPGDNEVIRVIPLEFADVETIAQTLQALFSNEQVAKRDNQQRQRPTLSNGIGERQHRPDSPAGESSVAFSPYAPVEIQAVGQTNQLLVKAFVADLEQIERIVQELDVFVEPIAQNYSFTYVDAVQVYSNIERILNMYSRRGQSSRRGGVSGSSSTMRGGGGVSGSDIGVTLVERSNSITLVGPPSSHRIMASIVASIDVAGLYETGSIEVYDIENADVDEIANTLRELLQETDPEKARRGEARYGEAGQAQAGPEAATATMEAMDEYVPKIEVKVSVNAATNSVIVQATARQHREIRKLVDKLDIRRKQVSVRAMIIEITRNDNYDLGVELDYVNKRSNDGAATSFGLSQLDFLTGARTGFLGTGATLAVLDPRGFQAIVNALSATDNVRIRSSPQILVNDNATGSIESLTQEPTRETNLGQTATTTSFGEYVDAGTQFQIVPHISESNYLHIEYVINLSSFGEKADPGLPPTRSTSTIQSSATIPDGYTIVVGGIERSSETKSVDKVPLLGDVPLLGALFRNTAVRKRYITTYLFITTTIMDDENFEDLTRASSEALEEANKQTEDSRNR